ncbi:uncharacterized protein [Parasteatoda tepidariorum]|uniref:uncharacterized protein n=1 Tax=Parasteatoda tepidariorum TaxID=114398 RepID=UPI0039BCB4D7
MAAVTDITNEIEDKKEFLRSAGRRLDLKGLVDEEILYTFCGNGRKYILFILQLYPKIGKVYFTNLMDSFNVEHIPRKAELLTADLQDISKLSAHKEYFTHIASIDCFNWYRNARNGFNVIHHLLRLGGTAAILMTINSPFEDCFKDLIENSAWKHTDLNQESVFPKFPIRLSRNEYKELVKDIGFSVVECEEYYRIFEFESLLDFYEKCEYDICFKFVLKIIFIIYK